MISPPLRRSVVSRRLSAREQRLLSQDRSRTTPTATRLRITHVDHELSSLQRVAFAKDSGTRVQRRAVSQWLAVSRETRLRLVILGQSFVLRTLDAPDPAECSFEAQGVSDPGHSHHSASQTYLIGRSSADVECKRAAAIVAGPITHVDHELSSLQRVASVRIPARAFNGAPFRSGWLLVAKPGFVLLFSARVLFWIRMPPDPLNAHSKLRA